MPKTNLKRVKKLIKKSNTIPPEFKEKFLARIDSCSEEELVIAERSITNLENEYKKQKIKFYVQLDDSLQTMGKTMSGVMRKEVEKVNVTQEQKKADNLLKDL